MSTEPPIVVLHNKYLAALHNDVKSCPRHLSNLRKLAIIGMPNSPVVKKQNTTRELTTRGKIWKVLLHVRTVDAQTYLSLLHKHKSDKYERIRDDSFRTFASDAHFQEAVPEASIVRLLNSFQHYHSNNASIAYRQGLNVIAGTLLYNLPEPDAFFAMDRLVMHNFPLYWLPSLDGASAGCKLVDETLQLFDPELTQHLNKHKLDCVLYGFSCVLSLSSPAPPFEELMVLWDFLFAYGVHWNVLAVVAQVLLIREQVLASDTPKHILDYRKWPSLRARSVVSMILHMLPKLPVELRKRIEQHATDVNVCSAILGRPVKFDVTPGAV